MDCGLSSPCTKAGFNSDAQSEWDSGLLAAPRPLLGSGTATTHNITFHLPWSFSSPGLGESIAAIGVRNRPWIWLIATFSFYASLPVIASSVTNSAEVVMASVQRFLWTSIVQGSGAMPVWAAYFSSILIFRAAVGSFIAFRKTP